MVLSSHVVDYVGFEAAGGVAVEIEEGGAVAVAVLGKA